MRRLVRNRLGLGAAAAALAALLLWTCATGIAPGPEQSFAKAERLLRERFGAWRKRVERAAGRIAALAADAGAGARERFALAARIVAREQVDGAALVDWNNHAAFWAGRTFEADPENDFFGVKQGLDVVQIFDQPAHPLLVCAAPAGERIAVAFLAFDERFPARKKVAEEVAASSGLLRIRLRFGSRTIPVPPPEQGPHRRKVVVIDGLVHATFWARSDAEKRKLDAAARGVRLRTLLFLAVTAAAWVAWRKLGGRLEKTALLRALLGVALLLGLRGLLLDLDLPSAPLFGVASSIHPLWSGPGDTFLSALVLLACGVLVARAARRQRPRREAVRLTIASSAGCLVLPRAYLHLLEAVVQRQDGVLLFDPLKVVPSFSAALLLAALCLLTGALFLCVEAASSWARQVHRLAWPLPFLALAAGMPAWQGAWLALACGGAAFTLGRPATRPEKAAALVVLAAAACFPILWTQQRADFARSVAGRTRALLQRTRTTEVDRLIRKALDAIADPEEGVDRAAAQVLAEGRPAKHLAFKLWAAARWDPGEPCAVQVWDTRGNLVSAFDFDSPPAGWLPPPPTRLLRGPLLLSGSGKGEAINFHAREFDLRTIGDERPVGIVRICVPDRWDLLLSPLRPSMFSEPLDLLVRSAAPPLLLADLDPEGEPRATSAGTTADLQRPGPALLATARKRGYAAERIRFREQEARLVLVAGRYGFAALVFDDALLEQGAFVFAKLLLTFALLWLLYVLGLLIARRGHMQLLFRHRVGLVLILLSLPPVYLLATYNQRVAEQRHLASISERLERRLDLAETLLRERKRPVDNAWCAQVASNHLVDINVYRGTELAATSRPGIWDTGLLGRRLAAQPYVALELEGRQDYTGKEFFGRKASLMAAYRRVDRASGRPPLILSAPALEDRRALERSEARGDALLLAIYMLSATLTVFLALWLGRSLTRPVQRLREATRRVAAGELDARLPLDRQDEFGDLVRAFNRMTEALRGAQDLRVRAEKAAAWREMARQVAHEIKNPLTPIKLTVQNLLALHEEDPPLFEEEFARGASLILDQIEALHRIAGAFSAYARFPSQRMQPLDLNELIVEVADLYAAGEECAVGAEPAHEPLFVRADPDELRRVLINLVTNARQARARKVRLTAAARGDAACLEVIDDGAGIPAAVLEHIFEPSFTTKTSGTGLGMPIVKRILDDYGATIHLTSTPETGTRVTIRIRRCDAGGA